MESLFNDARLLCDERTMGLEFFLLLSKRGEDFPKSRKEDKDKGKDTDQADDDADDDAASKGKETTVKSDSRSISGPSTSPATPDGKTAADSRPTPGPKPEREPVLDGSKKEALEQAGRETFYITTAINYTNGSPHIGHAYEGILTDVIARYHREYGRDTFFLTGTDEHGQKVEKSALAAGISPKEHCDKYATIFRNLTERLNMSNDDFIRTTDERHEELAKKLWIKVRAKGDIYLTNYTGWYDVHSEQYVTDKEAEELGYKDEFGRPFEKKSEEAYFFRMSKYQDALVKHFHDHPEFCQPEERRKEMLRFLESPLNDLCVSRTVCQWGVQCPPDDEYKGESNHVMYVWFDALSNYLSGIDYLSENSQRAKYWPAVHIIGKDIVRFHCIYWPTMLMSAGIPLPKVYSHGFVSAADGRKMSKSLGNVVDPYDMLHKYPVDTFRFYLASASPFGGDVPFSEEAMVEMHNSTLLKQIGNLMNRGVSLGTKYCDGYIPSDPAYLLGGDMLPFDLDGLRTVFDKNMCAEGEFGVQRASFALVEAFTEVNKYLTDCAPWSNMKGDDRAPDRRSVVRGVLEALYALAHFLCPFCPETSEEIFSKIGVKPCRICALSSKFDMLPAGVKLNVGDLLFVEVGVGGTMLSHAQGRNSGGENVDGKKKARTKHQKGFNRIATDTDSGVPRPGKEKHTQNKSKAEDSGPKFAFVNIRVGKIMEVKPVPSSDSLFVEKIDLGEEDGPRNIVSGLRKYYTTEDMEGRHVLVLCNIKSSKLADVVSQGMVLCATSGTEDKVELIEPPSGAKIGERVVLGEIDISETPPASSNSMKKHKIWSNVQEKLSTDEEGIARWDGNTLVCASVGNAPCKAKSVCNAPIS